MKSSSKTINVKSLGPVLFEKSKRAKRPNISIRPYKGIRVAVPNRMSFAAGEEFLRSNIDWAIKSLKHVKTVEQEHGETVNSIPFPNKDVAKKIIIERLGYLAQEHSFKYNNVFIKNQKSRWGSCSENLNINLNINLVKLRDELMDYVILHELVHIEIQNHSKEFWSRLDQYVGDAKRLDKELGKHRLGL